MRSRIGSIIIVLLVCSSWSVAQEPKVQSVFIYNFMKYIEWPATYKTGDFVIGVLGDTPMFTELQIMARTKKYGTQTIKPIKFKTVNEISQCHILFIPKEQSGKLETAVTKTNNYNTLIITEDEGLAKKGATINFVMRDNRQKFELNKANLLKHNLQVNSKLESLAIMVN